MKVDLFELLDGFFRGVVYFVYSLVESTFRLVRHPLRGPAHLQRARRAPDRRQISAVTFLFMAYLGAYAFELRHYSEGPFSPALSESLDAWWPILAASLASTVIVDMMLRLAVQRRHRQRRRREFALATAEYAMLLPALLVTIVVLDAEKGLLFNLFGPVPRTDGLWPVLSRVWPKLLAAFGLACVLVIPAVRNFWRGGYSVARRGSAPAAPPRLWAARLLGMAGLAMLASTVGGGIHTLAYTRWTSRPEIRVASLLCHPDAPHPYVDMILSNRSRAPLLVDAGDLFLYVGPLRTIRVEDVGAALLRLSEEDFSFLVFRLQPPEGGATAFMPGESKLVRANLPRNPRLPIRGDFLCILSASTPDYELPNSQGRFATSD
jgi:hypothetical protein